MAKQPGSPTRRAAILAAVRRAGEANVAALAAAFSVTPQTIRRDLNHLADRGLIARVHGGAELGSGIANARYDERRGMAAQAKARIGAAAAALVPEGASLFINIGTTTEAVAHHLVDHQRLMVVTNNLNVVDCLLGREGIAVIAVGGQVRAGDRAVIGALADQFIDNFRVDLALIGASGLTEEGDLVDFDADEVLVARRIIRQAKTVILVADSSKFGRAAPIRIAGADAIDHLVTDRLTSPALRAALVRQGVTITETG
ncbi:DeoR/GlpR family DNA-binding transcription regulator [Novosphingobium sp. Fuku2-ISO-50]|uniref:DeoR/GlpR family DNA-binding transcription regulator n=1 Tax=Novosphingobium sp. Fuku2-ISO-50 TaxID=1739114 RepID=UPI00076DD431|nr:DeoR/GlpR family DNA-binding transcription regulator [Novosphingobium sp. Fuku2-ISO-50]KUR79911.1 DeoR family transcriptional regulator [Novosphingobium sp. Fuku2-ISO-50]